MIRNIFNKSTPQNIIKKASTASNSTTTIDEKEVLQFNDISSFWWDELGIMKPLHSMNRLRVPFIRDGLINNGKIKNELIDTPKPLKGTLILDVGCGGGILAEALARLGGIVTGIDPTSKLIQQAKLHASKDSTLSNLTYVETSIEQFVINNSETYDVLVTSEVIEHINEKDIFLEACVKCLKPGGSIFITTLNKTSLSWGAILATEYILNIIPRGTHEWNKCIAPHHTQRMLEDYKCYTKLIHGLFYNVLTNKWMWINDTSVSYALHAVKD